MVELGVQINAVVTLAFEGEKLTVLTKHKELQASIR
jgi:hypothetical protein